MFVPLLLAAATETRIPVDIEECAILKTQSYERGLAVRFRNMSSDPIVKVTFHVHNGKHSIDVADSGTFAPGTDVDHVLATPQWELQHGDVASCTIKSVTFANGQTWTAPPHP